jgi:hypothetical protein
MTAVIAVIDAVLDALGKTAQVEASGHGVELLRDLLRS